MKKSDLQDRTKAFALRVLKLTEGLPKTVSGRTIANQIARSATSVAANYRAACRGKSKADFISKLGTVEEEADEPSGARQIPLVGIRRVSAEARIKPFSGWR